MSTFLFIWELWKLFTLKLETRWNWPSFSSRLTLWADLSVFLKGLSRLCHRIQVHPEPRSVPGARAELLQAYWAWPEGRVCRSFSDSSLCGLLLFSLPLSLPLRCPWLSQTYQEGTLRKILFATHLKLPLNRRIKLQFWHGSITTRSSV